MFEASCTVSRKLGRAAVSSPYWRQIAVNELKLVAIYFDGMAFGDHVMIGVVGMDAEGHKHVLSGREGAAENATMVKQLLERSGGLAV